MTTVSLDELQTQLRRNERIWAGFRNIELALLGARSLREIVETLSIALPRAFPGIDCALLACIDPKREIARLAEDNVLTFASAASPAAAPNSSQKPHTGLLSVNAEDLSGIFPLPYRPRLGRCDEVIASRFFANATQLPGSVALAPLVLRGRLIGGLIQASNDPAHFAPDAATDLLEHLTAVTAICIDNMLSHERLKLDGLTDPLTGAANRRFFERRFAEEMKRARRSGRALSCMLVDVDHFKRINDTHGHPAGDQVLCAVASVLSTELRAADVLARYGGEEFVLLLPETDGSHAGAIAERLRRRVESHRFGDTNTGAALDLTVSIGYASAAGRDAAFEGLDLVRRADQALYEAKRQGRNRVVCREVTATA